MEYILIGLLVSIGWYLGRLIINILDEIVCSRLHKTKWYPMVVGKHLQSKSNTMDVKTVKNKIGFM